MAGYGVGFIALAVGIGLTASLLGVPPALTATGILVLAVLGGLRLVRALRPPAASGPTRQPGDEGGPTPAP